MPNLSPKAFPNDFGEEQFRLASEIISLLPREYASSAKRANSLQAIFSLSKKLNRRKKQDRQILQKVEKLIAMCAGFEGKGPVEEKAPAQAEPERRMHPRPTLSEGLDLRALKERLSSCARKVELLDSALQTARTIEDPFYRAEALSSIASEQAKAGMFKEASETARTIEYAFHRAKALSIIASEQAKAGMDAAPLFKEASETARTIKDAELRAEALSSIASEQAKASFAIQVQPLSLEERRSILMLSHSPHTLRQLGEISTITEIVEIAGQDKEAMAMMAEARTRLRNAINLSEEEKDSFSGNTQRNSTRR